MLIMPSFQKSLIVEQFQGNYLKITVNLNTQAPRGNHLINDNVTA